MKLSKAEICKEFLKITYKHFRKEKINYSHGINWFNQKSSEWGIHNRDIDGTRYMIVAIAGSNDVWDWILNVYLGTINGFKFSGWWEAKRVYKSIKKLHKLNVPVILAGHSKSGTTLPPLEKKLRKAGIPIDHIYSFEPATSVRKRYKIKNMTMFLDPDDIVPDLGKPILKHPICSVIKHPGGKSGKDHSLSNWDGHC